VLACTEIGLFKPGKIVNFLLAVPLNFAAVYASDRLWSCSLLFRQYWVVNSGVLITKRGVASSVSLRRRRRWRGFFQYRNAATLERVCSPCSAPSRSSARRWLAQLQRIVLYRRRRRRRHDRQVRHREHSPGRRGGRCGTLRHHGHSTRIRAGIGRNHNALSSGKRLSGKVTFRETTENRSTLQPYIQSSVVNFTSSSLNNF